MAIKSGGKRIVSGVGSIIISKKPGMAREMESQMHHALTAAFNAGMSTSDIDGINKIRAEVRDRVKKAYGV